MQSNEESRRIVEQMFANAMAQMMPKIIAPLMAQFWTNVASGNNEALTTAFSDVTKQGIFKLPAAGKKAQKNTQQQQSFGQGGLPIVIDLGGASEASDSNRKGKATMLHVYSKLRWHEIKSANPTWNRDNIRKTLSAEYKNLSTKQREDLIERTRIYNITGGLTVRNTELNTSGRKTVAPQSKQQLQLIGLGGKTLSSRKSIVANKSGEKKISYMNAFMVFQAIRR